MFLPPGYKVGFGINLKGLGADANCAQYQNAFDTYNRLAKKDKKKATIDRAKALRDENLAKYYACIGQSYKMVGSKPVATAPLPGAEPRVPTPAPVIPILTPQTTPVTPATPVIQTEVAVGTQGSGGGITYIPTATTDVSTAPLPVPGETVYPAETVQAPAQPQTIVECDLAGLGKLPMTYSDQYGSMKVLGIYGCQAASAAPASQQVVQQQIQSSDLWS
jgi:hypothetical protein